MGPEIETFLDPEMGTSVASAIWAQKSQETRGKRETRDFRVHSEMVYNNAVRSLRGRIKGVEGVGGWGVGGGE